VRTSRGRAVDRPVVEAGDLRPVDEVDPRHRLHRLGLGDVLDLQDFGGFDIGATASPFGPDAAAAIRSAFDTSRHTRAVSTNRDSTSQSVLADVNARICREACAVAKGIEPARVCP
jgi:hypothetical protein